MMGAVVAAALLAGPAALGAQSGAASVKEGVYTEAQARRGAAVMEAACSECHVGDEFTGPLVHSWGGARVVDLYDIIRSTMPQDRPGALEPQAYADVLAYIFQLNGLPPGPAELTAEPGALRRIIIEWSR